MSSFEIHSATEGEFGEVYRGLLTEVVDRGAVERNARTGKEVKVARGQRSFGIDLRYTIPMCGVRRLYPATAAAETAWYLSGSRELAGLGHATKIWEPFAEEDGTVENAYGYRWRRHFGRDQISLALEALKRDSSDRRVVVSAWDPAQDGLGSQSKNVPCPTHFTFNVVEGELHSSLFLRSSDVFVGLPYDVMGHALLMDAMSQSLGLSVGHLGVTAAHLHLYESHYLLADTALDAKHAYEEPALPRWDVEDIVGNPQSYVDDVRRLQSAVRQHPWACTPELVK